MSAGRRPDRSVASIAGVRESARALLKGLGPIAQDAADTMVLIVSELVTNALRHGGGAYGLDLVAPRTASRWPCTTTAPRRSACASPP
ncbi:ATP-binding protein [Streptomyces sp. NBC_00647]|uniref:ATP-binding protein n=1 Tax=Streptomyces sp. NBC_00647 TaxID=2975796 RepID=UPI003864EB2B